MLWICSNKSHCICSIRISHTHACHWEAKSSAGVRGRHRHRFYSFICQNPSRTMSIVRTKGFAAGCSCGSLSLRPTGCLFLKI
ncbi:hypothetical protein CEXT_120451 [Caerostris extrusa]|uniref:Uncharacterized protein n=1 Tax=Caerostris extrusa TaxID=172846 RepID=A0AAV4VSV2_CAEEX|nr:hypothetical protein CEXT_120451 [Caerostris extrusa]